ncbi:tuberin-like [Pollicipes pollicipes]|uniref:tuberin-like n=1 Tax=Pollicipes pollicipes TaxID=41117 RepID=UPI0018859A5E|nr:tuberin-like [Pollicipes pollicipes]
MSKEKEKHFQDRLKKFFKQNRDGGGYSQYLSQPFEYTPELRQSLRPDSAPGARVRVLQELVERVKRLRLDDLQLVTLLSDVQDLLHPSTARDLRHAVFAALVSLVNSQLEHMTAAREELLDMVARHNVPDDFEIRVRMLSALTEDGRNLTYIEEAVPPLLLQLLPEALQLPAGAGGQTALLRLLQNCVKFNAAYVESEHVQQVVELIYTRATAQPGGVDTSACLALFDVILCYSDLPRAALVRLAALLARLVCQPHHARPAWRLMRNLLGTSMGHVTLQVLTELLMNRANARDPALLKGCIFFGSMALWGGDQRGGELLPHAWDLLLDLVDRLYTELERCAADRPEAGVVAAVHRAADHLLTYRYTWLSELRELVTRYYDQDGRTSVRLAVCDVLQRVWDGFRRLEATPLLETVLLPAAAALPAEPDAAVRARMVCLLVRVAASCRSPHCLDVLALLERVLTAPLEAGRPLELEAAPALEAAAAGLAEVLERHLTALPSSLAVKTYRVMVDHLHRHYAAPDVLSAVPAVRTPLLLCLLSLRVDAQCRIGLPDRTSGALRFSQHLLAEQRHAEPAPTVTRLSLTPLRLAVIAALGHERHYDLLSTLLLRVPRLLENKALVLSEQGGDVDYFAQAMCQLSADITPVLCGRLTHLPDTFKTSDLQSLVYPILVSLTSYHNNMSMPMHRRLIGSLESGLRSRCAPQCMAALTVCALGMREAMAKLIHDVLISMSRLSSTVAMGNSVLEFLSTLIRIPKVYSRFNEEQYMSIFAIVLPYTNPAKFNHYIVSLAHHVIAMWFLKCKVKYRRCFVKYIIKGLKTNFSNIQAIWRQQQALGSQQTAEGAAVNEDSSNRRRSSSLSDRASQARGRDGRTFSLSRRAQETPADPGLRRGSLLPGPAPAPPPPPPPAAPISVTRELIKFHRELTETCVDLMARYTGANYAVLPERTAVMELLLARGLSNTWVVGNKLVTVTVGGCGGTVFRRGLCEKCYHLCWCQGWAEILVRRPSGNMAWMTRLENRQLVSSDDLPAPDLLTLIAPGTSDQTVERLLRQAEPAAAGSPPPQATVGSPPPPAPAPAPPEINIIQEDAPPRRPLSRTRSGETRRHSLFKSISGGQMPPVSPRQGRDRSHTISVMSPTRRAPAPDPLADDARIGLLPEQVLLQLFHSSEVEAEEDTCAEQSQSEPHESDIMLMENGPDTERTLAVFDRITPMETHKIGVLYVAAGQAADEAAILRNQCGSARYNQFLQGLGRLVELTEAQPDKTFLAGLDRTGSDGRFAIMWEDDLMQVLFHVATMMPTVDERCNNKKMHIGNDFVLIVYNESGQEFNITTIRAQFCYAGVVVEPLDHGTNRIVIRTKGKLQELFGHTEVTLVSDQNLAVMARQLALHANLASLIQQRGVAGPDPYASNWLERLRHIKRVRRRVADRCAVAGEPAV